MTDVKAIAANCWRGGAISVTEIAAFRAFEVSPVREDGDGCITRCGSDEADFWTVYGVNERGHHDALHDARAPDEIASFLIEAMRAAGEKPVGLSADDWFHEPSEWVTLVEALAFEIARRVEEKGAPNDPEGMAEAMEREPLSAVHEAFSAVAPGAQSERGGLDNPFAAFTECGSAADDEVFASL